MAGVSALEYVHILKLLWSAINHDTYVVDLVELQLGITVPSVALLSSRIDKSLSEVSEASPVCVAIDI